MSVRVATYEQLALEDPEGKWELHGGRPRRKPGMTAEHNAVIYALQRLLITQLDHRRWVVSADTGRLRLPSGPFYIPDLCIFPRAYLEERRRTHPRALEVYDAPVPLVVEVWSPSTGDYDVDEKLAGYQARGDAEIWRLHPYDKTLTRRLRQPDGSYVQMLITGGSVEPAALPGVTITISELFA